MMKTLISNIRVYAENRTIDEGYVLLDGTSIIEVGEMKELSISEPVDEVRATPSMSLIPGMIDLHIHGADGADAMDSTPEAIKTIAEALPKEGTTSFLPTTMTTSKESIENALVNLSHYMKEEQSHRAEAIGIHLEGPFISPKRAGAQHPDHIIEPSISLFKEWQDLSGGNIKLVTVAPEVDGGLEFVSYLKEHGVVASIGHTDAVYSDVKEAIKAGVTHATHLFNGMRGIHHREIGVAGGVLMHPEVKCEMIVDGIHISPEMVKFAYMNKSSDGVILITDSMRAKCLGKGTYDLGGQEVNVDEDRATLENGTLAGSILKMKDAVKNMMSFTQCDLEDIIQMTSVNPAKQLSVFDRKGSIKAGKDADLVLLDEEHNIMKTFCRGKLSYSREKETTS
ncbi:N-acetylglucosamine-6-phosphate deacetylase [Bacillus pakistanensis]|nr:N-acetylglucosamine-6-phosphate deacetylase [Bacillus pakistanensis]